MSTIREIIINEIGPTNMALADRKKILALGEAAVPVLIDLFQNPSTPYGDINQATAADALIEFSKKGNKDADAFMRKIALGKVPLTASWGREAQQIVQQHFEWIGVDPATR
jgi:hypothetical protein